MDGTNESWEQFRSEMPVTRRWAYFDHAAVGPLPSASAKTIAAYAEQLAENGDTGWLDWHHQVEATRRLAAELVNADSDEIALVPSTTAGIGIVAEGFHWQPGDNVVTLDNEFPSNLLPWLNLADRGVETRRAVTSDGCVDLGKIAELIDGRTRIVSVSWIGYASGYRIDVGELASLVHDRGALLMLDAIQGLGVFPLDLGQEGVDFAAADGHKWMLGPEGAGIFFCRSEHLDKLRPIGVGWHSARRPFDFSQNSLDLRRDAARYEGGTANMVGFMALGESLRTLARYGLGATDSSLSERVVALADYASERIQAKGGALCYPRTVGHQSGIVTFGLPGSTPEQIRKACLASNVVVSCRGRGARVSLHAYNSEDEIERMIHALP